MMTVLGNPAPSGDGQEMPTGQLVKQLTEQVSQLFRDELRYRIRCRWKGEEATGRPGPYAPDVDDGVKVNIRPFQEAGLLAVRHPDLVTTEQRKDKRGPRIYADIMRNAYAQLAITPYSVRARPGAPVAAPLSWDEVEDKSLSPDQFTLRTLPARIRESCPAAGPWAGMGRRRTGLARARTSLRRIAQ